MGQIRRALALISDDCGISVDKAGKSLSFLGI